MVRGEGMKKKNKAGYACTMVVCVCAVTMKKKIIGTFCYECWGENNEKQGRDQPITDQLTDGRTNKVGYRDACTWERMLDVIQDEIY